MPQTSVDWFVGPKMQVQAGQRRPLVTGCLFSCATLSTPSLFLADGTRQGVKRQRVPISHKQTQTVSIQECMDHSRDATFLTWRDPPRPCQNSCIPTSLPRSLYCQLPTSRNSPESSKDDPILSLPYILPRCCPEKVKVLLVFEALAPRTPLSAATDDMTVGEKATQKVEHCLRRFKPIDLASHYTCTGYSYSTTEHMQPRYRA